MGGDTTDEYRSRIAAGDVSCLCGMMTAQKYIKFEMCDLILIRLLCV